MAIPGISKIETLATKYSKPQLANMAQMGLIAPTEAVMAGMMIDRIMAENMKPPTTTVADDVLAPPQMAMQSMPPQGAPPQVEQMGMPPEVAPEEPTQMAASGGLASLPSGDVGNYAGGGMVAFARGGTPYEIYTPELKELPVPTEATAASEKARQLTLEKEFGVEPKFYDQRAEEFKEERKALGKEKKDAWIDALIMGGLKTATGKSPYALSNIAEGGVGAFETYQGLQKDIRERDKALRDSEMKLKEAQNLRSVGKMDAADKRMADSEKAKREAESANIAIQNKIKESKATAQTEAGKTGFEQAQATGRTSISAGTQMAIAKLPPDQLRLLQATNEQDVAAAKARGLPEPTLTDTYVKMHPGSLSSSNAPAKSFQDYTKDWNKMGYGAKDDFMRLHPGIDSPEKYANFMMGARENPSAGAGGNTGTGGVDRANPLLGE